jgi:hypothetical protein
MNSMLQPAAAGVLVRLMEESGHQSSAMEIGRDSLIYPGGNAATWADLGKSLINPLVRFGVAAKCGRSPLRFEITERGRIAVALFRAKANRRSASCKS